MTFPQKVILADFICLTILWYNLTTKEKGNRTNLVQVLNHHYNVTTTRLSRTGIKDIGIAGWQDLFPYDHGFISDGTVSMGAYHVPTRT